MVLLRSKLKKQLYTTDRRTIFLCLATFFMCISLGSCWVSLPYIIKRLGGTDSQVGFCFGFHLGVYMIACLSISPIVDRFNPKLTAFCGAGGPTLACLAMVAIVIFAQRSSVPFDAVIGIIIAAAVYGLALAFFWPSIMGWISHGCEGHKLNRRLSIFNLTWALAGLVTPYFAGRLVEINSIWPLWVAVVFAGTCVVLVIYVLKSASGKSSVKPAPDSAVSLNDQHANLVRFRWMSRVALLVAFICTGLMRTQLPLLIKYELGFLERHYGMAALCLASANVLFFWIAGKTRYWHYKLFLFFFVQGFFLIAMLVFINCRILWPFYVAAALFGAGQAFNYSSHLYYSLSGGKKRSAITAIHEATLSSGFVIGAFCGGFISDHFADPLMPYRFGIGAIGVGLVAQIIIWFSLRPKEKLTIKDVSPSPT